MLILLLIKGINGGDILVLTSKASMCLFCSTADEPLRVQLGSRAAIQCRAAAQGSRSERLASCGARLGEVWIHLYA